MHAWDINILLDLEDGLNIQNMPILLLLYFSTMEWTQYNIIIFARVDTNSLQSKLAKTLE